MAGCDFARGRLPPDDFARAGLPDALSALSALSAAALSVGLSVARLSPAPLSDGLSVIAALSDDLSATAALSDDLSATPGLVRARLARVGLAGPAELTSEGEAGGPAVAVLTWVGEAGELSGLSGASGASDDDVAGADLARRLPRGLVLDRRRVMAPARGAGPGKARGRGSSAASPCAPPVSRRRYHDAGAPSRATASSARVWGVCTAPRCGAVADAARGAHGCAPRTGTGRGWVGRRARRGCGRVRGSDSVRCEAAYSGGLGEMWAGAQWCSGRAESAVLVPWRAKTRGTSGRTLGASREPDGHWNSREQRKAKQCLRRWKACVSWT
jgi:hypothetical protein